jgi:hypothetical protein
VPGISTSSDIYQNRNQGLTTYRKDAMGPALSEEMAKRTEDRAKAAQVQARQEPASVAPKARPVAAQAKAGSAAAAAATATSHSTQPTPVAMGAAGAVHVAKAAPVTPPKVVHELYAPMSRATREHDDRYSMITGGTVDVRA